MKEAAPCSSQNIGEQPSSNATKQRHNSKETYFGPNRKFFSQLYHLDVSNEDQMSTVFNQTLKYFRRSQIIWSYDARTLKKLAKNIEFGL